MEIAWYFYIFDYASYLAIRPILRAGQGPADFTDLAQTPETLAILDAVAEESVGLSEARCRFVQALCCLSDPLAMDRSFARSVAALARLQEEDEAGQLLSAVLAGGKNLEPWLIPAAGLSGFLTPAETVILHAAFVSALVSPRKKGRRRRRRRGGLLGLLRHVARLLLDSSPEEMDTLRHLFDLIDRAVREGNGIAVTTA